MQKNMPTLDWVLARSFYRYGCCVYRYRWLFLVTPCLMAIVLSSGIYFLPSRVRKNSVETFTPTDGASLYEKAVVNSWFPLRPNRYLPGKFFSITNWAQVIVISKDRGNLLRDEVLNASRRFNDQVLHQLSVWSDSLQKNLTFMDMCLRWDSHCFENPHLKLLAIKDNIEEYVHVTYPVTRTVDSPTYLGTSIGGVQIMNDKGNFDYCKSVRLVFDLQDYPEEIQNKVNEWRSQLERFVTTYDSPYIDVGIWHDQSLNDGLQGNVQRVIPNFAVTYLTLTIFCVLTNFVWTDDRRVDWVRSKPIVGFLGVCSPGLAVVIALGLLLILGLEYNLINSVMPILVVSVGVSDMFIMTAAWQTTERTLPTEVRIGEMMYDAGVAITITSVTDVISFAIGAWCSLPAVTSFCIYTAFAIAMDYACQITFFAAVMAFFGDFEAQGRHSLFLFKKIAQPVTAGKQQEAIKAISCKGSVSTVSKNVNLSIQGDVPSEAKLPTNSRKERESTLPCEEREPSKVKSCGFFQRYSSILFNPVVKMVVIALYVVYISTSVYGCFVIKEGLRPSDLVPRTHSLIQFFRLFESFNDNGQQVHIVVSRPPDFSDKYQRDRFFKMVSELESGYHSMGKNSTIFFAREFLNYLNGLGARIDNSKKMWTEDLHDWMRFTSGRQAWVVDTVWGDHVKGEDPLALKAFRFQIAVKNFDSSLDQMKTARFFRGVVSKYPEFNVTTYHEFWPYIDQYLSVKPTTWRNLALSFGTMIVIAIVLIPNVYCGLFITLSMLSINVGVYGFMALWDVRLDAISMITLIMSIGFAVDLSAHISYGYVISDGTPHQRATLSLERLGYPVFLSGIATLFGVCALSYIDVYMVVTFFKTVFLVIVLGLLHSHMFLPIALTILLPKNSHRFSMLGLVAKRFKKTLKRSKRKTAPIKL